MVVCHIVAHGWFYENQPLDSLQIVHIFRKQLCRRNYVLKYFLTRLVFRNNVINCYDIITIYIFYSLSHTGIDNGSKICIHNLIHVIKRIFMVKILVRHIVSQLWHIGNISGLLLRLKKFHVHSKYWADLNHFVKYLFRHILIHLYHYL